MDNIVSCTCAVCLRHKKIEETLAKGDLKEIRVLVDELLNELANAETDAAHYHAILTGKWPRSKEILQKALDSLV